MHLQVIPRKFVIGTCIVELPHFMMLLIVQVKYISKSTASCLSASGHSFSLRVISYPPSLKISYLLFLIIPAFLGSDYGIEFLIADVAMATPMYII